MSAKANPLYQANNLSFSYALGTQAVPALREVNLTIERGEFLLLTGPSGSGKSTLLSLLGLIEPVQNGDLQFAGESLRRLTERRKNQIRRFQLGFIFQSFHLMEALRADENVEYFLARQRLPHAERRRRVDAALSSVGLSEFKAKRPGQLSGGQRQRVAIARAVAKKPAVIIADEPTANLDQATGRDILTLLRDLAAKEGATVIMASHDLMAEAFATRKLQLCDGHLVL